MENSYYNGHFIIRLAVEAGREGLALRIWPELHMLLGADTGTFEMYGEKLRTGYCKGELFVSSTTIRPSLFWPKLNLFADN